MDIRAIVLEAMDRKGWDYKAVASHAVLPAPTVNRYCNGRMDLTGRRLGRILEALGLVVGTPGVNGIRQMHPSPDAPAMRPVNLKAILRLPGSKWMLMAKLVGEFLPHEHFVSLFGGTGNDILRKPPSLVETYNDIDERLVNFYRAIGNAERYKALKDRLMATSFDSPSVFDEAVGCIEKGDADERAWAILVMSHIGYCTYMPPTVPRYARKPHPNVEPIDKLLDKLDKARDRFKNVRRSQMDWSEALKKADSPATFLFADPPYLCGRQHYDNTMTEDEHEHLLATLNGVQGSVMLLGYDSKLYRAKLKGWRKMEFMRRTSLDMGGRRPKRIEMVWMNYGPKGERLISTFK